MRNPHLTLAVRLTLSLSLLAPPLLAEAAISLVCPVADIDPTTCDPEEPDISASIDANLTVRVRNCSNDPNVRSLLELVYAMPGGNLTSTADYGSDETRVLFTEPAFQASCTISSAAPGQILEVMVTSYRTTGGTPATRRIGPPLRLRAVVGPPPPATTALTADLEARLQAQIRLRNVHSPATAGNCAPGFDPSDATLNSLGRETLRGLFKGKTICSTARGPNPRSCTVTALPENHGTATQRARTAFELGPEACTRILVNGNTPYPDCCDPVNTLTPSVVSMQCSRAIVTELAMPSGPSLPLDRFLWTDYAHDIEPSFAENAPSPEDVQFDCFDFAAETSMTPPFDVPQSCSEPESEIKQDIDHDGIFDCCDFLVGSETTQAGGGTAVLKRHFRNQDFNSDGDPFASFLDPTDPVAGVEAGGLQVDLIADVDTLTLTWPAGLTPGAQAVEVQHNTVTGLDAAVARDMLQVRRVSFVSTGGSDHVLPFDEASGELMDLDPIFANAVPDVPDGNPDGVAFTTETGNENNELLIGSGGQVFVHEMATNALRDLEPDPGVPGIQGARLTSPVGALALDPLGKFAFALHGGTKLGAVDARAVAGSAGRFQSFPAISTMPGSVRDLSVRRVGAGTLSDDLAVYVTGVCDNCTLDASADCGEAAGEGMMGGGGMMESSCAPYCSFEICEPEIDPNCGGGGGGGGGYFRKAFLSMRILRPIFTGSNVTSWSVECSRDVRLSQQSCVTASCANADPVPRLGLDLSSNGEELYIANPQSDGLLVINTVTNDLIRDEYNTPMKIAVGVDPFDVEILKVFIPSLAGSFDRAYVANHGSPSVPDDDWLSIVDTDPDSDPRWEVFDPLDIDTDFELADLEIEILTGSESNKLLFLVSGRREHVLVYDASANGQAPAHLYQSPAGPGPRRVAVQEGAP